MNESPCMVDNAGRQVTTWLAHMQSTPFLRSAIARGERTDDCWVELRRRNRRVAAARSRIVGKTTVEVTYPAVSAGGFDLSELGHRLIEIHESLRGQRPGIPIRIRAGQEMLPVIGVSQTVETLPDGSTMPAVQLIVGKVTPARLDGDQ